MTAVLLDRRSGSDRRRGGARAEGTPSRYATPAGRVSYARCSPVAVAAAPRLGVTPGTAHQMLHGDRALHTRLALLVETAVALGDHATAERLVSPILAAYCRLDTGDRAALALALAEADAADDVPRLLATLQPECRETARRAVQAVRATVARAQGWLVTTCRAHGLPL